MSNWNCECCGGGGGSVGPMGPQGPRGLKGPEGELEPLAYVEKNANYTATPDDQVINFIGGPATLTLITAVGLLGKGYIIKNTSVEVIVILPDGIETIDGNPSVVLNQWDSVTILSTDANWIII